MARASSRARRALPSWTAATATAIGQLPLPTRQRWAPRSFSVGAFGSNVQAVRISCSSTTVVWLPVPRSPSGSQSSTMTARAAGTQPQRTSGRPSAPPSTRARPPIHVAPWHPVLNAQRPLSRLRSPSTTSRPKPATVDADAARGSASTSAAQAGSPPAAIQPSSAAPWVTTHASEASWRASAMPVRNHATGGWPAPPRAGATSCRNSPASRAAAYRSAGSRQPASSSAVRTSAAAPSSSMVIASVIVMVGQHGDRRRSRIVPIRDRRPARGRTTSYRGEHGDAAGRRASGARRRRPRGPCP